MNLLKRMMDESHMKAVKSFASGSLFFLICVLATRVSRGQVDCPQVKLTTVASGFTEAVHTTSARDGSDRLFVAEQLGRIKVVQSNTVLGQPFLDITDRVYNPPGSLFGLLSMAFPTNYASKGYFYVYYSRTNDFATVISRFFVSANTNQANAASEQVVLVIPLGGCNPNLGGQIAFGPEGYLYISTGDDEGCTGTALAQTSNSFWGKILR